MQHAADEVNKLWRKFENQSDSSRAEVAPEAMFESDLEGVLRSIGRGAYQPHPFVVDCGYRPDNYRFETERKITFCLIKKIVLWCALVFYLTSLLIAIHSKKELN